MHSTLDSPFASSAGDPLDFMLHSPMDIHITDASQNHTGLIPNPNLASDLRLFEKTVPNSYYRESGHVKYAGASVATATVLQLHGTGLGFFTLTIAQSTRDTITASTTYENLPVATSTIASMVIPQGGFTQATIPDLLIDVDGDGINDVTLSGGGDQGISEENLVALLKGMVKTMNLPADKKAKLLRAIHKLEQELIKEHKNKKVERFKTNQAFLKLFKTIEQYEKKKILTKLEADELRTIIQQIRSFGEGMFQFPEQKPKFNYWDQHDQERRWGRNKLHQR
jgi:hypothetical protein